MDRHEYVFINDIKYMLHQRIKKFASKNKGHDDVVALIGLDAEYGRIR